jgi:hypothetical protein
MVEDIEQNEIDFMEKYNICRNTLINHRVPDNAYEEFDKLGCPFKTMMKEVYHANKFKNYVLVLYVSEVYYKEDYLHHLEKLGWEEIPRISKYREHNFVKVIPKIKM